MITRCTFIGQRPNSFPFGFDETDRRCEKLKLVLTQYIQLLYSYGVREFYTGCVLGVELWAAEIVLELMENDDDISLFCVIPYADQSTRWSLDQRERYEKILNRCTQSITLNSYYHKNCIYEKDQFLVQNTDILVAVYGQEKSDHLRYMLEYAKIKKRGIIYIDPETAEVTPIMSNLMAHNR